MSFDKITIDSAIILNNSVKMPILGLGTWSMHSKTLKQAVEWSLEIGYRHFDTARYYKNEKELGEILNNSKYPREDLFITSKVWPKDFGLEKTEKAFEASLKALSMDYLDQYLIHWPKDITKTHETWKTLEKIHSEGKCKSIGVSNFSIADLENLKSVSEIVPATNQIEFHPYKFDLEILDYCRKEKIGVVSYSPLTQGRRMKNPIFDKIAIKHNKTVAQVLLRWGLQHNTIIIPKSANKERLKENALIYDFELSKNDMEELNSLSSIS
jgi:diketogulonate reductase-like aldo/keto reductase